MRLRTSCLLLLISAWLAGCAGAPRAGGGPTAWERERLDRLEAQLESSPRRVHDPDLLGYLERFLRRLATGEPPRLYVIEAPAPQADLLGARLLRLRTGMLAAVATEDELAFVLAHELAHGELGHLAARRDAGWDAARAEREADAAALRTLARLRFDPGAPRALLERLAAGLPEGDRLRDRIEALPQARLGVPLAGSEFERALRPYRSGTAR